VDEPIPIEFQFTDEERNLAREEGFRRRRVNVDQGTEGRNNCEAEGDEALKMDLLGAAGEMAFASYFGMKNFLYTELRAKPGSIDLPPDIDVKTTDRHSNRLICQLDEAVEKRLVLVTIENMKTLIRGWRWVSECKRREWIKDPTGRRPAYFIPTVYLHSISTLAVAPPRYSLGVIDRRERFVYPRAASREFENWRVYWDERSRGIKEKK